jgi:hypothetical protein
MGPEVHIIDREERLQEISGVDADLSSFLSDVYQAIGTEETRDRLRALRQGVAIQGIEATLRASEILTSVAPRAAVPFRSRLWTPVSFSDGAAALDPAPYRILGVRDGIQAGESRWLDVTYDPSTGTIQGQGDDAGIDGTFWVPEMRMANPYMASSVSNAHELSLRAIGPTYPPPHLAYLTTLIESVRQTGNLPRVELPLYNQESETASAWLPASPGQGSSTALFWVEGGDGDINVLHIDNDPPASLVDLAMAVAGVPFAYQRGKVTGYVHRDGLSWAKIETPYGNTIGSFLPRELDVSNSNLKTGAVNRFEPLLETSTSQTGAAGSGQKAGPPVSVDTADPKSKTIVLEGSLSLSEGDRIILRNIQEGTRQTLRVVDSSDAIVVEGELFAVTHEDAAYVEKIKSDPAGKNEWAISINTPLPKTPVRIVRGALRRALPPDTGLTVNYQ